MLISSAAETTEGVFNQYTAGEFGLYSIIGFLIVIAVLVVLIRRGLSIARRARV